MTGDWSDINDLPGEVYIDAASAIHAVIANSQVDDLLAAIREIVRDELATARAKGGYW